MYAVIRTGGKQYRVKAGDIMRVEKLDGKVGDEIVFEDVLMVGGEETEPLIGKPKVTDAKVIARIVQQDKAKKVVIFKHKRRKGYRLKRGHRQHFTGVTIKSIEVTGKTTSTKPTEAVSNGEG